LLADEILTALCAKYGHPELAADLVASKAAALKGSVARGNPPDDLKSARGEIFNAVKKLFPTQKWGSDAVVFLKTFCAPLVMAGTTTYATLRRDIFER
jgi:hypothetical protein